MIEVVQRLLFYRILCLSIAAKAWREHDVLVTFIPLQLLSEALDGLRIEYGTLLRLACQGTLNHAVD